MDIRYVIRDMKENRVLIRDWDLSSPLKTGLISCGHTTDFYLGKTDLPRANSSKICRGKFISGFVLPW